MSYNDTIHVPYGLKALVGPTCGPLDITTYLFAF